MSAPFMRSWSGQELYDRERNMERKKVFMVFIYIAVYDKEEDAML
jgi:hypothetical protein